MSKNLHLICTAALVLVATPVVANADETSALLDLLVKKKIITAEEAKEVRSELKKEKAPPAAPAPAVAAAKLDTKIEEHRDSATKWKLSTPITEIELYGDARVRYESRWGETGAPNTLDPRHDTYERQRERYRLRLGLRGTLSDDWFFGVRFETGSSPRSTNVTFGDDSGPFGKSSDTLFVGQAYAGYKGFQDITLTVGKMPNPFITTSMVWDADISPEGASEQWKHTFKFGGDQSIASSSKDGKQIASGKSDTGMSIDLFANFGQFVYDDSNPENPIGPAPRGVPNTDAFLLGWQVGAKLNWSNTTYFQFAPTLYNYTGTGDSFFTHFSGDPDVLVGTTRTALNQTGVNSLLVYDMPAEFGWSVGKLPVRVFGDFAVNLDASDRAVAAGHPDKDDQRYAYQVGVGVGKIKAKNDWAISAFWQHTEQYALDPNMVDTDFFDSRINLEGVGVTAGYAVSDAVTFNITYGYAHQIDHALGTGGVGDIAVNPLREYQLFQADLNWKF